MFQAVAFRGRKRAKVRHAPQSHAATAKPADAGRRLVQICYLLSQVSRLGSARLILLNLSISLTRVGDLCRSAALSLIDCLVAVNLLTQVVDLCRADAARCALSADWHTRPGAPGGPSEQHLHRRAAPRSNLPPATFCVGRPQEPTHTAGWANLETQALCA